MWWAFLRHRGPDDEISRLPLGCAGGPEDWDIWPQGRPDLKTVQIVNAARAKCQEEAFPRGLYRNERSNPRRCRARANASQCR